MLNVIVTGCVGLLLVTVVSLQPTVEDTTGDIRDFPALGERDDRLLYTNDATVAASGQFVNISSGSVRLFP